jgi:large subunit ribosomal protein L29
MLKAKELRDQSVEELELMYHDTMHEMFELVNKAKMEKPEQPHLVRQKRRLIARLLTVLREKQSA